jgi:hypothetical protein
MMVLKLMEGLGLAEAGIIMFEDTEWNKQRAGTSAGHVVMKMLACLL